MDSETKHIVSPVSPPFVAGPCNYSQATDVFGLPPARPNFGHGELTGKDAFAAAVAAGVPVECSRNEVGNVVLKLAHPVAVFADGDTIKVFHCRG